MRHLNVLCTFGAFLLAGCAGVDHSVRINSAYKCAALAGRTLHILPPIDVVIPDLGKFEAAFRKQTRDSVYDPASILADCFLERLRPISEAEPARVAGLRNDTAAYRDTLMALPDQLIRPDGEIVADGPLVPVRFLIPEAEQLRKAGVQPDLGLQIGHLHFEIEEKEDQDVPTVILVGAVAGELLVPKPKVLHMSGTFLIWDYRKGAPVAFGWVETATTFKFAMDITDWKAVIRDAAESIVKATPLKGKKYQRLREQNSQNGHGFQ